MWSAPTKFHPSVWDGETYCAASFDIGGYDRPCQPNKSFFLLKPTFYSSYCMGHHLHPSIVESLSSFRTFVHFLRGPPPPLKCTKVWQSIWTFVHFPRRWGGGSAIANSKRVWAWAKPSSNFDFVSEPSWASPARAFWLKPAQARVSSVQSGCYWVTNCHWQNQCWPVIES